MQSIFHITPRQQWETAQQQGIYSCESLETEGFIHCSTLPQVCRVANFLFTGQSGLVLLEIDGDRLQADLRYEPVAGVEGSVEDGECFPHVYAPLNLEAIVQVFDFEPEVDGSFQLPQALQPQT